MLSVKQLSISGFVGIGVVAFFFTQSANAYDIGDRAELIQTGFLSNGDLSNADLNSADLNSAFLYGGDLSNADLSGADLSGAFLYGSDLSNADLSGADLSGAFLYGSDLSNADLSGAKLSGADFNSAFVYGSNLNNANLSDADLEYAFVYGSNLNDANLSNADLEYAFVYGSDLNDANLSNADLRYAFLYKSDLSGSDLSNADLEYAFSYESNLSGADFSNANLNNYFDTTENKLSLGEILQEIISTEGTNSSFCSQSGFSLFQDNFDCDFLLKVIAENEITPDFDSVDIGDDTLFDGTDDTTEFIAQLTKEIANSTTSVNNNLSADLITKIISETPGITISFPDSNVGNPEPATTPESSSIFTLLAMSSIGLVTKLKSAKGSF